MYRYIRSNSTFKFSGYAQVDNGQWEKYELTTQARSEGQARNHFRHQIALTVLRDELNKNYYPRVNLRGDVVLVEEDNAIQEPEVQPDEIEIPQDESNCEQLSFDF